ncbi:MAG TPA: folylpolyglutamate synthase/dihydrofolate synthase family protein [Terriglobales bacterium]|nr:folylpolyglutamate synthase/dihydrofolate synthase family protein [Terriglobales bacterium]
MLAALGDPQSEWASVHVAGTNGKGSVCAILERVLRESGVRTGLFTSPHLVDFRERIRVDGQWADEKRLTRRLELVNRLPEGRDRTFFEVCTALAFDDFAAREAEWSIVEVGLGGRLDATNVIEPALAVVTAVGIDHADLLGDTVERVAVEKAGIVKPDVPVVSGLEPGPAADVIARAAEERGAPLVLAAGRARLEWRGQEAAGMRFAGRVPPWGQLDLTCPLRGRHQLANARTALAALSELTEVGVEIESEAVVEGFASVRWPGRLEPCPGEPALWWDGAHNPDGFAALRRAWSEDLGFPPPSSLVLALSRDKDVEAIARALEGWVAPGRVVTTQSRDARAMPSDELGVRLAAAGQPSRHAPGVVEALEAELAVTAKEGAASGARVLLCGSLFAVADAMEAFGGAPGEWL